MKVHVTKDKKFAENMRNAIKANDGYCPCKLERTDDTKCMCKEFRDSNELGTCHCGLYIKDEV